MKSYIVIEWNGETYEDSRDTVVEVYLDANKAAKAVKDFNDSRDTPPVPITIEKFIPNYDGETYEEYCIDLQNHWLWYDKNKKQHIEIIEITE